MAKKLRNLFLIIFFFCFSLSASHILASSDAIAIRIISNPEHYSALDWYKMKGFEGSPQSIMVDGYEGVRDGRTVYVSAANVQDNNLYTNIYLISHNQDAENFTTDIFGQILSFWKFNINLPTSGECVRKDQSDGGGNLCLIDSDCGEGEYCNSEKAVLARDTKRLSDWRSVTDQFSGRTNLPGLEAGTYLSQTSFSVWPSWQQTLSRELGVSLPKDPINAFVGCGDEFNPITCWSEADRRFDRDFEGSSSIYGYHDGSFCMNLEGGYTISQGTPDRCSIEFLGL